MSASISTMKKEAAKAELIGAGIGALGNVLRKKIKGEKVSLSDVAKGAAVGAGGTALVRKLPSAIKASRGRLSAKELEHVKKGQPDSMFVGTAALPERLVRKGLIKKKIKADLSRTIKDPKELKKAVKKQYKKELDDWESKVEAGEGSKSSLHKIVKKGVIDPMSKADIRIGRFMKGMTGKKIGKLFENEGVASGVGPLAKTIKYGAPAYLGAHAYKDVSDYARKKQLEKESGINPSALKKALFAAKGAYGKLGSTGKAIAVFPVSLYAGHKLTQDYKKHVAPGLEKKLLESGILYKDVEDQDMTKKASVRELTKAYRMRKLASVKQAADSDKAAMAVKLEEFEKKAEAEDFLLELINDRNTPATLKPTTIEEFLEKRAEISHKNLDVIREAIRISSAGSGDRSISLADDSAPVALDDVTDFLLS